MTPDIAAEWRRLLAEATPGPTAEQVETLISWLDLYDRLAGRLIEVAGGDAEALRAVEGKEVQTDLQRWLTLAVYARNHAAELLDELDRLRGERDNPDWAAVVAAAARTRAAREGT